VESFKNLDKLPQDVQDKFIPYLRELLALYPGQVRCAAVYGSAAGQNYVPKRSDINSVIILDEITFSHLDRALKVIARGTKQRIPAPLFLTKDHMASSLDVFPVEFLDIKENHVLIFGEDLFASLTISGNNLELFCEHEIKGKLIRVRQAYLERGLKGPMVEALLKESLHALVPVFRNLIRLKSGAVEMDKVRIVGDLARTYELDSQVFLDILKHKLHGLRMSSRRAQELMEKYLIELEKLAKALDRS